MIKFWSIFVMQLRKSRLFCLAHGVLLDNGVHPPCFEFDVTTTISFMLNAVIIYYLFKQRWFWKHDHLSLSLSLSTNKKELWIVFWLVTFVFWLGWSPSPHYYETYEPAHHLSDDVKRLLPVVTLFCVFPWSLLELSIV